ncbi:uncharacterized protein B0T15DRAFT_273936 [Chaetomium strumarium]|uniref:Uncharacterized protein n=1 Tax=Chaetomium strumarium TaxID=1170767 RepID=A0AAJ0LZI0_9PEZI|nr:hypothetical protein B0T15DRAFT_273936 [Chaetomium strumarium]
MTLTVIVCFSMDPGYGQLGLLITALAMALCCGHDVLGFLEFVVLVRQTTSTKLGNVPVICCHSDLLHQVHLM